MIRITAELANGFGTWIAAATVMFAAAMLANGIVTPSAAQSYGGPGGGRGGRGADNHSMLNAPDPHVVAMAKVIAADPEDPLPMILADRNEIKLTDSQTVTLSMLESRLRIDNGPLHDRLDELRPPGVTTKVDYAHLDPASRDSLVKTRAEIAHTMGAIHDNDLAARQAAFDILTPDQRDAITDLEKRVRTMINTGIPRDDAEGGKSGGQRPHGQSGGSG